MVVAGDRAWVSGTTATHREGKPVCQGDVAGQTTFILDILKKLLEAEGLTYGNLVAITIYATSSAEFFDVAPIICGVSGANGQWFIE